MDLIAVLRGLVLNPLLVAFARGILEAAAMAGILFASEYLTTAELGDFKMYAPLAVLFLRQLEGVVDKIDPAKQRRRDELRDAAQAAAIDESATKINVGDVVDPAVPTR
jgi:hypothetical protein